MRKRYLSAVMAFNLGRIMRLLIGFGIPWYAQVLAERALLAWFTINEAWSLRLIDTSAIRAQWGLCCIDSRAPACSAGAARAVTG